MSTLVQWKDWKLPAKLAAVTLVPLLVAVALGISAMGGQLDRASDHDRTENLLGLSGELSSLLDAVQRERTDAVLGLAEQTDGDAGDATEDGGLAEARAAVDEQAETTRETAGDAAEADARIGQAEQRVDDALDQLTDVRANVDADDLDAAGAIDEYSTVTGALLELNTAAVDRIPDSEAVPAPRVLDEMSAAKEAVSAQHALIGYGIERGVLGTSELNQARRAEVSIEDGLASFDALATAEAREAFTSTVSDEDLAARDRLASAALGELGSPSQMALAQLSADEWATSSGALTEDLGAVTEQLHSDSSASAGELATESRTGVAILAIGLVLAFALALTVAFAITRELVRSLRRLRAGAIDVAEHSLPHAVRAIQEGAHDSNAPAGDAQADDEPAAPQARDEIGQVAGAFDTVHRQALKLAGEQAEMRDAYNSVFVNLSRRSQSLVQRQLQLIEQLERDEQDADQLATLFQLDHLATRMRRNNENLMVLSGSESGRRSGKPVSTADVLRAAVSEIEQYQRVVVQSPPTTKVVGHAASDLMRLLAELLDNATAFSPPETRVTIATSVAEGGTMTIDVLDSGIGMHEEEVADANARMQATSPVDLVTSRRMGLFVVGRLAGKHGFSVTLHGGKDIDGVRASVSVPAELVVGAEGGPLTAEMPAITDPEPSTQAEQAVNGAGGARQDDHGADQVGAINGAPAPADGNGVWPLARGGSGSTGDEGQASTQAGQGGLFAPTGSGERRTSGEPGHVHPDRGEDDALEDSSPGGSELFVPGTAPLSDWWTATTSAEAPRGRQGDTTGRAEKTPIFDETVSVWFREPEAPEEHGSDRSGQNALSTWDFAVDKDWRTVQQVSNTAVATYTEAGLPRRQRGEQLLPGSAAAEPAQESPSRSALGRADRSADDSHEVRGRLSNFQRGLSKGRSRSHTAPQGGNQGSNPAGEAPAAPSSSPDAAAQQDAASQTGFTESGLPRRRRGQQLVAGSAQGDSQGRPGAAPQPERDPDAMRGRLSSFQQGIRRGRGSSTTHAETQQNGAQQNGAQHDETQHDEKREIGAADET